MAKYNITKERIKYILQEHKTPEISEATERWAEKVLTDIVYQLQEEAKEREEKLATKEDLKMMFEAMQKQMDDRFAKVDDRFEMLIKEMNLRFQNVDVRFEAMQKQMDERFEMLIKEMNLRFQNVDVRFEAMQKENNARFEALEKRLTMITWFIGIGFSILAFINIWTKH